jgi:microcin-processing metallopeptidase PmbA/TldD-like protein
VISRRDLVRALVERNVADWVVIERELETAAIDETRGLQRREKLVRSTVILHHEDFHGRGTARLEVGAREGDAQLLIDRAISLAISARGPAWKSVPPAAPAKVPLLDPALDPSLKIDLVDHATRFLRTIQRPRDLRVTPRVAITREVAAMQSRSGSHAEWTASHIVAHALVASGERSIEVTREARRFADLGFDVGIDTAREDLEQLAKAGPPTPGRCALVLAADALLHADTLGVWAVFATQADSVLEREGLTRYRVGAPIVPGADQVSEPLTIASDGALEYATRSAPLGDDGDAVRKFTIIERGVCTGIGLTGREAALRHRDPNGGVRNLVVYQGTWDGQPTANRTVEVRRLRALSIDPYTGDASLEIRLAVDRRAGVAKPFAGGTVRLDLVGALARARRSSTVIRRGAYEGPAEVLIEDAELIA